MGFIDQIIIENNPLNNKNLFLFFFNFFHKNE